MTDEIKLAVEHADWSADFFKWVYVQAFLHGYKHGKQKVEK